MSDQEEPVEVPVPEPDAPDEAVEAPPAPPAEPPLNAVIVFKKVDERGVISTEVQPNGTVQPTEVQTILELGIKAWRQSIGLAP